MPAHLALPDLASFIAGNKMTNEPSSRPQSLTNRMAGEKTAGDAVNICEQWDTLQTGIITHNLMTPIVLVCFTNRCP